MPKMPKAPCSFVLTALLGLVITPVFAQNWSQVAVISPTAPLSTSTVGGLCYTDGEYIACDGTVAAFDLENGRLGISVSTPLADLHVNEQIIVGQVGTQGEISFKHGNGVTIGRVGSGHVANTDTSYLGLYGHGGIVFDGSASSVNFRTMGPAVWDVYGTSTFSFNGFTGFGGEVVMKNRQDNTEVFHAYLTAPYKVTFPNGNVGISVTNPTAKLEVAGTISATGLTVSGTANVDALVVNGTAITSGGASSIDGLADAAKNDTDYNIFLGHTGGSVGAEDDDNIALGHTALDSLNNSGGDYNIALGRGALTTNTEGDYNIAIGYEALNLATTNNNTAVGYRAGYLISGTVAHVSAMGYQAAFGNTGTLVSAMGSAAAFGNTGSNVSAMGYGAAYQNTGPSVNAMGRGAAEQNRGSSVIAVGHNAARYNTGAAVSVVGHDAAHGNNGSNASVFGYQTIRYRNASNTTAIGYQAGRGGDTTRQNILNGTFLGYRAGYGVGEGANNNLYLGYDVGQGTHTGSNNILIGYDIDPSSGTASNELNIGNLVYGNTSVDRVGINVPSPTTTLEVAGTVSATAFQGDGSLLTNLPIPEATIPTALVNGTSSITVATNGAVTIDTAGTRRMTIAENGNVGIGTTSPLANFHINALSGEGNPALISGEVLRLQRNNASNAAASLALVGGSAAATAIHFGDNANAASGQIIYNNSTNSMNFNINGSQNMGITSSGNVGIGRNGSYVQTSDTSQLKVYNTYASLNNKVLEVASQGWSGGQTGPFYGVYVDASANNASTARYGVYAYGHGGGGGPSYGVYGLSGTGSSTRKAVGVAGHVNVNSGAVNNHPAIGTPVAGVMATISTTGTSMSADTTALLVRNESVYGDESYGAYIDALAGPTKVIPLRVDYNTSEVLRVTSAGNLGIGTNNPDVHRLHAYVPRSQLLNSLKPVVHIQANDMDNLGDPAAANPSLLKLSTTYGGVPRGKLFEAVNKHHSFTLENSGSGFARLVRGESFVPALGSDSRNYHMLGISFDDVLFDGATPLIGTGINLNVNSWTGGTPSYSDIYGVAVKITDEDVARGNRYAGFYADVSGADNNYAMYAAAGKTYFADNVGIGTTAPNAKLEVAGTISATGLTINGEAITAGASFAPTATAHLNMDGNDITNADTVTAATFKTTNTNVTAGDSCAGRQGEIVFNATQGKFYVCTNG